MIGISDKIRWRTVNGYATGEVVEEFRPGEWKVKLPSGMFVIVSETSAVKV